MYPPLKALHSTNSLSIPKLVQLEHASTEALQTSLMPGQPHCLKTRPDGTILDGHHRVYVLQQRGVNVNSLPREVIEKDRE
jgi:hypothetical protein